MALPLRLSVVILILAAAGSTAAAQTSGNVAYGQNGSRARAEQNQRNQLQDAPADGTLFVYADVLMNVKADEYVAVFALDEDGATVGEVHQKMDAKLKAFLDSIKTLHVRPEDVFVDFVTQPKVYGYEVEGNLAKEKLTGFELKKNVSVHYTDRDLIDKLVVAATAAGIYDLVKVDYIVRDTNAVELKLRAEAAGVIKQKIDQYEKLLGIRAEQPAEIWADVPSIYYPSGLYESYAAAESDSVTQPRPPAQKGLVFQTARKERTFYFHGLDASGFDKVINPVVVEPVVQFTMHLKVKYQLAR